VSRLLSGNVSALLLYTGAGCCFAALAHRGCRCAALPPAALEHGQEKACGAGGARCDTADGTTQAASCWQQASRHPGGSPSVPSSCGSVLTSFSAPDTLPASPRRCQAGSAVTSLNPSCWACGSTAATTSSFSRWCTLQVEYTRRCRAGNVSACRSAASCGRPAGGRGAWWWWGGGGGHAARQPVLHAAQCWGRDCRYVRPSRLGAGAQPAPGTLPAAPLSLHSRRCRQRPSSAAGCPCGTRWSPTRCRMGPG